MPFLAKCQTMFRRPAKFYALFMLLWVMFFLSSGGLTLYNKWIISVYGFDVPVWLVTITYSVSAILCISVRLCAGIPMACCKANGCCGRHLRRLGVRPFARDPNLRKRALAIVGVGAMAAIEVSTSNVSLLYLDVSYHIMLRAAIPVFVLLWAFVLRLEKPSWKLAAVVLFICGGVVVLTYGKNVADQGTEQDQDDLDSDGITDSVQESREFSWTGTAYVLVSCFCAGIKWALSELTLGGRKLVAEGRCRCCSCCCFYTPVPNRSLSASPAITMNAQPASPSESIQVAEVNANSEKMKNDIIQNVAIDRKTQGDDEAQPVAVLQSRHSDNEPKLSPFSLLSMTALVSAVTLLPVDFLSDEFEGIQNFTRALIAIDNSTLPTISTATSVVTFVLVLVGCSLVSVIMILVTYMFIKLTSGLTLSVVNIAKQLLVIGVSIAVYGDVVTWLTLVGFGLCIVGLVFFNFVKYDAAEVQK